MKNDRNPAVSAKNPGNMAAWVLITGARTRRRRPGCGGCRQVGRISSSSSFPTSKEGLAYHLKQCCLCLVIGCPINPVTKGLFEFGLHTFLPFLIE